MSTEWAVREKAGSRVPSAWPSSPLRLWGGMDSEAEAVAFIEYKSQHPGRAGNLEIVSREVGPWIAAEDPADVPWGRIAQDDDR